MRKDEITVRARKNLKEFLLGAELGCYWWRMQHKKKFEVLKVLSREKKTSLIRNCRASFLNLEETKEKKPNNITKTQVYSQNLKQIVNHIFIRREKNIRVSSQLDCHTILGRICCWIGTQFLCKKKLHTFSET